MTQKELLYMEDATSHEQNLETIFNNSSNELEDKNLSTFIQKLAKKHHSLSEKLLKVMEDLKNEW